TVPIRIEGQTQISRGPNWCAELTELRSLGVPRASALIDIQQEVVAAIEISVPNDGLRHYESERLTLAWVGQIQNLPRLLERSVASAYLNEQVRDHVFKVRALHVIANDVEEAIPVQVQEVNASEWGAHWPGPQRGVACDGIGCTREWDRILRKRKHE